MPQQDTNDDWWSNLNGKLKVFIAVGTIWLAGASSNLFVDLFFTTPADLEAVSIRLATHMDRMNERVGILEAEVNESRVRQESRFIYLGCMLEAFRHATQGTRCKLVLSPADRELIETIVEEDQDNGN